MKKKQQLVSVKKYASMCKVSRQMVYSWIDNGSIIAEKRSYGWIIDVAKNGVKQRARGGRKSIDSYLANEAKHKSP